LRRRNRRLEPRAHTPVVRREVVVPERALLADPEQHVHALGRHALNGRDAVACRNTAAGRTWASRRAPAWRSSGSSPGAEPGGPLDFDEEVRAPRHRPSTNVACEMISAPARMASAVSRAAAVEVPRLPERDLDDLAPPGPETFE